MSTEKNELAELFTKHLPEFAKEKLKTFLAQFKAEDTKEFTDLKTKAEAFIAANKDAKQVEAVKAALASAEKDKFKIEELKVLLAEEGAPAESYNEAPLADGTILKYTGDLAVGSKCILVTPTGEVPAPEGEHKLADGSTIVIKKEGEDSVISEIKPAEEMNDQAILASIQKSVEATAKELKDLSAKFSALEKENKSIKAEHEATKLKLSQRSAQLKDLGIVVAEMAAIGEEPINQPNKNKPGQRLSTVVKSRF